MSDQNRFEKINHGIHKYNQGGGCAVTGDAISKSLYLFLLTYESPGKQGNNRSEQDFSIFGLFGLAIVFFLFLFFFCKKYEEETILTNQMVVFY